MPPEEPVVSAEQPDERAPTVEQSAVHPAAVPAHDAYEPIDEDDWLEEPEELPRRPRRRLLGAGGNPIFLALLGLLLIACGFIGGVLIEKGETPSSSSTAGASGLASRFAALRGGTSSTGAKSAAASGSASSGFARPTAGTVSFLSGNTLYVTTSEGNTVKVTTSPGTTVTKSVKTSVSGIHPGETVTVTGEAGTGGAVSAESISVGSAAGGGLAALFGGSGGSGGGTGSAGRGGAASGGAGGGQALFGGG
jgi:hypothetical protein